MTGPVSYLVFCPRQGRTSPFLFCRLQLLRIVNSISFKFKSISRNVEHEIHVPSLRLCTTLMAEVGRTVDLPRPVPHHGISPPNLCRHRLSLKPNWRVNPHFSSYCRYPAYNSSQAPQLCSWSLSRILIFPLVDSGSMHHGRRHLNDAGIKGRLCPCSYDFYKEPIIPRSSWWTSDAPSTISCRH